MNFNPMDLILIKEALYDVNSIPFNIISSFISKLMDIQIEPNKNLPNGLKENLGTLFFKKQEMIEHAYQIAKLNVFGDDKKL